MKRKVIRLGHEAVVAAGRQHARVPMQIHAAKADEPIRVELSNDAVTSYGHRLSHGEGMVDLSRIGRHGLPLAVAHNTWSDLPVGRVVNIQHTGRRLVGELKLGARGAQYEADIRDGIITDVSVGVEFDPDQVEEVDGVPEIRHWRPLELSLVTLGAVPGAQVLHDGSAAPAKPAPSAAPARLINAEELAAVFSLATDAPGAKDLHVQALTEGWSTKKAIEELAKLRQAAHAAPAPAPRVTAGLHESDKLVQAAIACYRYRTNVYRRGEEALRQADAQVIRQTEIGGYTFTDLARACCQAQGIPVVGLSREGLIQAAIRGNGNRRRIEHAGGLPAYASGDFTAVITTVANAALGMGFMDAGETWDIWTRRTTINDLQAHPFPVLSTFGDVATVAAGASYPRRGFTDKSETMNPLKKGAIFSIDMETLLADRLGAFSSIFPAMGAAQSRAIGDAVYAILTGGTSLTMSEDGNALFSSAHGNNVTAGGVPSVSTVAAGITAIRTQTDPNGNTISSNVRYLITSVKLSFDSQVLCNSANGVDPAKSNDTEVPRAIRALTPVADPRIDAVSSGNEWYLAAEPGPMIDTVAVGFLAGQESPYFEQREGFDSDGIDFKTRFIWGVAALDWRGLYRNDGVT